MTGEHDPRDRHRRLMMAALDGELSDSDRVEFDGLLERDEALRREWEDLHRVKEVTDTMGYKQPPAEIWEDYWTSVYNKLERGVGWLLFWAGTAVLTGFGIWKAVEALLRDTDVPTFFRVAIFAMFAGLAILLLSVIREKLFTRKRDGYKGVQR